MLSYNTMPTHCLKTSANKLSMQFTITVNVYSKVGHCGSVR